MIEHGKLIASGFEKTLQSEDCAPNFSKVIPVKSLSKTVQALFNGTEVNDSDIVTIWIDPAVGMGISVWDCNAHYGTYSFDDPTGRSILQDAGLE